MQQQGAIDCQKLTVEFLKYRVRVNCTPTSKYVRVAIVSTEEIMEYHADGFSGSILEGLLPIRKMNHKIRLKKRVEASTLPTYSVPERYIATLNRCIRVKEKHESSNARQCMERHQCLSNIRMIAIGPDH